MKGNVLQALIEKRLSAAQRVPFGCVALAYWNKEKERQEMRCAEIHRWG